MNEPHAKSEISYIQAVNEALRWALDTYPESIIFGEDVGRPGGPYAATRGLHRDFGDRVFDTPISESAILGAGVGAGISGMRPIVEIMFADFFFVALDQLVNQASNTRYVSSGRQTCPLTVRSQQGWTDGSCAQHSQCVEAILGHIPGVRVGVPAFPKDAYAMLRAAVASDDPVVMLESRALYPKTGAVDIATTIEPLGVARLLCSGADATIVTWGRTVHDALTAAATLEAQDVTVDVIDLRWINPLDMKTVLASVEKTNRLLVAHEANLTAGFGAEVVARVSAEGFWALDSPVLRVGAPDIRVPAAPALQRELLVSADSIVSGVMRLLGESQRHGAD